jgi:energy-converting hydrogenase A subunit M
MSNRKQKTAIALTGAVALASGAYALGTQAGGGAASAADQTRSSEPEVRVHSAGGRFEIASRVRGGPFGLDNLADRLGVDESDLKQALEDVRPEPPAPGDIRDDFAEQLAQELGIDQGRVEDALERVRDRAEQQIERRRDDFAERLADRLNLDPDEVKEALGDGPLGLVHPAPPHRP